MSEAEPDTAVESNANADEGAEEGNGGDYEEYDEDDEDEDIQVTIGEIKPTATFADLSKAAAQRANAQKGGNAAGGAGTGSAPNAANAQSNKLDLDAPAFIGNVPVFEYNVDSVADEDKPWRKPGADITDYFNYGFNEDTWRMYCDRQRALRALFGESQATMKILTGGRMPMGGAMPRSIPSVVATGGQQMGGEQDDGADGNRSPRQDESMQQVNPIMGFNQPPPHFQRGSSGHQTNTISVIGTIGGGASGQGGPRKQEPQQGGANQPGFNFPGFPPGFRPDDTYSGAPLVVRGGPFNPGQAGSGQNDFSQPPPRFPFNPATANPAMLAAAMAGGVRLPMPGGGPGQPPADLLRLLQSNPALASQVLALSGVGARPPFPGGAGGPPTLGNMGQPSAGGDDRPGRTPSPRGGSTPTSSPERDGNDGGGDGRRRSRSPPRRSGGGDDRQRIGVLGGGGGGSRRDYDRRGGGDWDRGRGGTSSRDDRRDRRDRDDRDDRRRRDRDDRGRRGDRD